MTRTKNEHQQRFDLMRKLLPSRMRLEVRDVQRALRLSSTSLAFAEMKAWREMGLVEYEEPEAGKRYGTYYLKVNEAAK